MAFDFKKAQKHLYMPKTKPEIIDVPDMLFIKIDGKGNPNTGQEYKNALEILYGLSYGIKMSPKSGITPDGYIDYVVAPLEGLWWSDKPITHLSIGDKDDFYWCAMIRQPEFVTNEIFETAKRAFNKKKPHLNLDIARLEQFEEGQCAQILHIGPYDDEPTTIETLDRFINEQGYENDISDSRRHHEIYLGDPRKTAPEKLKTVIRHPIVQR